MTAKELLLKQLDDAEYQLLNSFKGLNAEQAQTKPTPSSFSIHETIIHLAEAAHASVVLARGDKHEWGSYVPADASWEGAQAALSSERQAAVAAMTDDENAIWHGHMFLVAHEYYHVGQIVAARMVIDPEWNPYAIYNFGG